MRNVEDVHPLPDVEDFRKYMEKDAEEDAQIVQEKDLMNGAQDPGETGEEQRLTILNTLIDRPYIYHNPNKTWDMIHLFDPCDDQYQEEWDIAEVAFWKYWAPRFLHLVFGNEMKKEYLEPVRRKEMEHRKYIENIEND
ncbi:MAG: hypothetical protein QXU18_07475 [Thermoplasmatales archaeon]